MTGQSHILKYSNDQYKNPNTNLHGQALETEKCIIMNSHQLKKQRAYDAKITSFWRQNDVYQITLGSCIINEFFVWIHNCITFGKHC